jgi:hypothetical protein
MSGQLTFDEYGRPFIIVRDQDRQKRLKGIDAHKVLFLLLGFSNLPFCAWLLLLRLKRSLTFGSRTSWLHGRLPMCCAPPWAPRVWTR